MKRLLTLVACIFSFHAVAAADLVAVYQRALQNDPQLREAEANRVLRGGDDNVTRFNEATDRVVRKR